MQSAPPTRLDTHVTDRRGRALGDLRLSVTDRCNLRCHYCMPEDDYAWLDREDVLHFEEMSRLVGVFASLGVRKVRLTGGEPLLRRELPVLLAQIAAMPTIEDLAMTTNGVLLAGRAEALRDAGLGRLTISLDTLDPARFRALTRRDDHARVLTGFDAARAAGFAGTKIDTVVIRGVNDDEIGALIDFGRLVGAEVRFIEYMDVGGATHWSPEQVVSGAEILAAVEAAHGSARPASRHHPSAPAQQYTLADGTGFGIIASTTRPFCGACNRSRLTADGTWYLCLYAMSGVDLRGLLRGEGGARPATDEELAERIRAVWQAREDRGAELRLASGARGPLVPVGRLRRDPRLEMHTRGG